MSLFPFFQWLATTRLSEAMGASVWAFAVVEMFHLLALAVLGGTVLILNLRLLGLRLHRRPVAEVTRELSPYALASLAVLIFSGALLVIDGPLRYYGNSAFRWKMLLLAVAICYSFALRRRAVRFEDSDIGTAARIAAVISLMLWLSVGLAGRAIGFI
jgi:hypothetical protein